MSTDLRTDHWDSISETVFLFMTSSPELRRFTREFLNVPVDEQCCHLQPFRLLKPKTVKWGKRYPLVLYLHGSGERGWNNCRQLRLVPNLFLKSSWREKYSCYVLAPQCPAPLAWPYLTEDQETIRQAAIQKPQPGGTILQPH